MLRVLARRHRGACSPTCWPRRDAPEPLALGRLARGRRRDGVAQRAEPEPDRDRARPRRHPPGPPQPARRRRARRAWPSSSASTSAPPPCSGRIAALAGRRRRAALRVAAAAAAVAGVLLAPVRAGRPARFWDQTLGFALDEQGLQRLPLPGRLRRRLRPNKSSQRYSPYVLLAGVALWAVAAVRTRTPLRGWAPVPLVAGRRGLPAGPGRRLPPRPADRRPPDPAGGGRRAGAPARRRGRTVVAAALIGVLGLIALHGLDRKRIQLLDPPAAGAARCRRGGRGPGADRRRPRAERARAVRRPPRRAGRPVFVAIPRYDLVKVGDPLALQSCDRPNPTRYDVMQPGVVTTAPVQREIVGDLERARPALVVRWLSPVARPARAQRGRVLQRRAHPRPLPRRTYVPIRRFGDYQVLRRTGG